jgi:nickel-type superoxide dismutase maturation protease
MLLTKLRVIGHSMEPAIKNHETVLVSGTFYWFKKPQIGDIVAVREAGEILVKRVTKLKEDKYFLEGDNKEDSLDSRKFGFIARQKIIGKVFYQF